MITPNTDHITVHGLEARYQQAGTFIMLLLSNVVSVNRATNLFGFENLALLLWLPTATQLSVNRFQDHF